MAVRIEQKTMLRVPLHMLGGICCFGRVSMSPQLMGMCAQAGVAISYLTEHGRLLARVVGFTPGNVLLRRQQYRAADEVTPVGEDEPAAVGLARPMVLAKILNGRAVLLRSLRDYPNSADSERIARAAVSMAGTAQMVQQERDLDRLRGLEGEAANTYFQVFAALINREDVGWEFAGRSRRPPRDNVNALLSFLYTLLVHDARSAAEAAGLDPQVGFLHRDRPGRPSLALDLMEELRAFLCDRLALSLINRRQVRPTGFVTNELGGVVMDDATRKAVLVAYQKRKQEELNHPFLNEKVSIGLLVHLQARLLARHLRGDLEAYPPFLWR